ncbi:hypothetical protein BB561_002114 [Smittium simulii]|uniref:Uncharacterized protein n=1 Tax=Smittium simulii TaxID=133385 RepID=A0A2T9YRM2_9FUNG|nr:hypothetical protein BB561_002114 [Smittium simulii]
MKANVTIFCKSLESVPLTFISCIASIFLIFYCYVIYSETANNLPKHVKYCKKQIILGIALITNTICISSITSSIVYMGISSDFVEQSYFFQHFISKESAKHFYNFIFVIDSIVLRCLLPLQIINIFTQLKINTSQKAKHSCSIIVKSIKSLTISIIFCALYIWLLPKDFFDITTQQKVLQSRVYTLESIFYQIYMGNNFKGEEIIHIVFIIVVPLLLILCALAFGVYTLNKNDKALEIKEQKIFVDEDNFSQKSLIFNDFTGLFGHKEVDFSEYRTLYLMGKPIDLQVNYTELSTSGLSEKIQESADSHQTCKCVYKSFSNYWAFKEYMGSLVFGWLLFTIIFVVIPELCSSFNLFVFYTYRYIQIFELDFSAHSANTIFQLCEALKYMFDILGTTKGVAICFAMLFVN